MPTIPEISVQINKLRNEKFLGAKRLREIEPLLSKLFGRQSAVLAARAAGEVAAFLADNLDSIDSIDIELAEISAEIKALRAESDDLTRLNNLIEAGIFDLQKTVQQQFHSELWEIYESDFTGILREFESVCGRLMAAQLGRSRIEGDFVGIVNWLVRRGELKDPGACFRSELEKHQIFYRV
jgi:hypothetical protein